MQTTLGVPVRGLIRRRSWIWFGLTVLLIGLVVAGLAMGSVSMPIGIIIQALLGQEANSVQADILWELRMPRVATAVLAGAALAAAGLMLQTWFRNPLAGPASLGVTAGASLGVAAVVLPTGGRVAVGLLQWTGAGSLVLVTAAAVGAIGVMLLLLLVAPLLNDPATLLVAGLMLGSLVLGVVALWQFYSTAEQLQGFLLWSFGSLGGVPAGQLPVFAIVVAIGLGICLRAVKALNLMLLGPAYAASAGLALRQARWVVLGSTGILVGAVTSFCGPVSFVGLAVPHLARGLFRTADHRILLPACLLLGPCLLLACDLLALWPSHGIRLPVNIVTALVGAPVVLVILFRLRSLHTS